MLSINNVSAVNNGNSCCDFKGRNQNKPILMNVNPNLKKGGQQQQQQQLSDKGPPPSDPLNPGAQSNDIRRTVGPVVGNSAAKNPVKAAFRLGTILDIV
jgi:hypothetical protein